MDPRGTLQIRPQISVSYACKRRRRRSKATVSWPLKQIVFSPPKYQGQFYQMLLRDPTSAMILLFNCKQRSSAKGASALSDLKTSLKPD